MSRDERLRKLRRLNDAQTELEVKFRELEKHFEKHTAEIRKQLLKVSKQSKRLIEEMTAETTGRRLIRESESEEEPNESEAKPEDPASISSLSQDVVEAEPEDIGVASRDIPGQDIIPPATARQDVAPPAAARQDVAPPAAARQDAAPQNTVCAFGLLMNAQKNIKRKRSTAAIYIPVCFKFNGITGRNCELAKNIHDCPGCSYPHMCITCHSPKHGYYQCSRN